MVYPRNQHIAKVNEEASMTIASDLLHRHFQTLVADPAQWQTLIADDVVWERPYAPAIGHPARLSGREEVVRHVTWFLGAVEQFRFVDLQVYACAGPATAVAEVKAETRIKPTGRLYRQEYVLLLQAARLHSSVNIPIPRAAKALDTPIRGLDA
jgi:uncharacterized protein